MSRRKRGRPRKKKGIVSLRQFARAGIVISAYDDARRNGEKHSAAVGAAVEFVKKNYPKMRMSETGAKRILAKYRPMGEKMVLCFDATEASTEQLARMRAIQLRITSSRKLDPPSVSQIHPTKKVYTIRLAERPHYPRHNAKPIGDISQ